MKVHAQVFYAATVLGLAAMHNEIDARLALVNYPLTSAEMGVYAFCGSGGLGLYLLVVGR